MIKVIICAGLEMAAIWVSIKVGESLSSKVTTIGLVILSIVIGLGTLISNI